MPSRDCSIRFAGLRVREVTHGSQKLLPVPRMRRRHPVALHASRSLIASRIGSATTFCCRWHGGALQAPLRPRFSDYSMLVCRVEPVRTRQLVRRIQAAAAASDRHLTVRTSSRVESKTTVRLLHSLPKMANQRCDRPSHTLLSPDKRSLSNAVQESGRRRFWSLGTCFVSAPRHPTQGNNSRNFPARKRRSVSPAVGSEILRRISAHIIRRPETDLRLAAHRDAPAARLPRGSKSGP